MWSRSKFVPDAPQLTMGYKTFNLQYFQLTMGLSEHKPMTDWGEYWIHHFCTIVKLDNRVFIR